MYFRKILGLITPAILISRGVSSADISQTINPFLEQKQKILHHLVIYVIIYMLILYKPTAHKSIISPEIFPLMYGLEC